MPLLEDELELLEDELLEDEELEELLLEEELLELDELELEPPVELDEDEELELLLEDELELDELDELLLELGVSPAQVGAAKVPSRTASQSRRRSIDFASTKRRQT